MASRVGGYVRRNHLGLIAIFIALGGTTYAAATIGSEDIQKNAVRSKHIKAKQVKPGDVSRKLRDGCPRDTARFGPICAGLLGRQTSWVTALTTCARATPALRLPTAAEAHALAQRHDVPGISSTETYWTDERFGDSVAIIGSETTGYDGSADIDLASQDVLCVTEPREGGK